MNVIKQPTWGDENQACIVLNMQSDELGEFDFVAAPYDCVEKGRELFSRALGGEFGEITPYKAYVPTDAELAEFVRSERDEKLAELDKVVSNPLRYAELPVEQKAGLAEYRQALLDVPQQVGFPHEIAWPQTPNTLKWGQ